MVSDVGKLQVVVHNRWPDGSVKFAALAGQISLPAGKPVSVTLKRAEPGKTEERPIVLADLKRSGATAQIGCGGYGSASWSAADWDAPFRAWISGSQMSSWIYRKQIGSDPHLVGWLEVRVFATGDVEVLPWIENGYLKVSAPASRSATFIFGLGTSQRFSESIDLPSHCRTPLVSGTLLSHWLGPDRTIVMRHDVRYLQSTDLVPTYSATVSPASPLMAVLPNAFVPLQRGSFNYTSDDMSQPGYQQPIGLLPTADVLYLVANSGAEYAAVVRNGYSAGRYALHYRDERTNRPIKFSSYPRLVMPNGSGLKDSGSSTSNDYTPTVSGTRAPGWDPAHSPSVGYLAYLLTGRWYFMEEVQFAATAHYLWNTDSAVRRDGAKGLMTTVNGAVQARSTAWTLRTLSQAVCVSPDAESDVRPELVASLEANIDFHHARYVAQPNNPFGLLDSVDYGGAAFYRSAAWMNDFCTAAFGYMKAMGLPISQAASTRLDAFFAWLARSAIGRLGTRDGFQYMNAAPYTLPYSPSKTPDFAGGTGPWYASWAEIYADAYTSDRATYKSQPWVSTKDGVLGGEIMPGANSFWGNLMPAIAYAVKFNVPGAEAAYGRLVGAANWQALSTAFNDSPAWSVTPSASPPARVAAASSAQPAWLAGKPLLQWFEIPGTAGAGGAAVDAYCGMAFKDSTNEIIISLAGGHGDSADNRVVSLVLGADAPKWVTRHAPSKSFAADAAYNPDGLPAARHVYQHAHYVAALDRVMHIGARFVYGKGVSHLAVDGFDLKTNTWDRAATWADIPTPEAGYGACLVKATGDIYTSGLWRWSPSGKGQWNRPGSARSSGIMWPVAHDARRNQLFALQWGDGQGFGDKLLATCIPLQGVAPFSITINPSRALSQFLEEKPTYAAMDYDIDNDRFLFYGGVGPAATGRIYTIQPTSADAWDMGQLLLAPGSRIPPSGPPAGVNNRFRYVPALKGCVLLAKASENVYFIRTS